MYRKKIVIDHACVTGTLRDFPVLVQLSDAGLRDCERGDVFFTADDEAVVPAHEIEHHDPETGELRAWVQVRALSAEADTVLFICHGAFDAPASRAPGAVWGSDYRVKCEEAESGGECRAVTSPNFSCAITVEAWIDADSYQAEALQSVVSKWRLSESFDKFDGYDAANTCGLDTRGFFGAVFDGRYVYFVPQNSGPAHPGRDTGHHGHVLRYDTQGDFASPSSWSAYDASETSGLVTRGYYGAVFDGRYVFFVPRIDGVEDSFAFALSLLKKTKVSIAPGVAFGNGAEGAVRICCAADHSILETAMERIHRFLAKR